MSLAPSKSVKDLVQTAIELAEDAVILEPKTAPLILANQIDSRRRHGQPGRQYGLRVAVQWRRIFSA